MVTSRSTKRTKVKRKKKTAPKTKAVKKSVRKSAKKPVKKSVKKSVKKKVKRKRKKSPKRGSVAGLDRDIKIWQAYASVQSITLTSKNTGFTTHQVRMTLANDKQRLDRIKQDSIEMVAALWEQKRFQALDLMGRTLQIYMGQMLEIQAAIKEGRTLTTIRGEDGIELPVVGARELMVKSRMMDQFIKLGAQAESIAASLRAGHVPTVGRDTEAGETVIPTDYSKFDDLQLVSMIEALGDKAPEGMRRRAELIRKNQRKSLKELDESV